MKSWLQELRAAGSQAIAIKLSVLALAGLAAIATLSGMMALFGGGWQGWLFGGILGVVIQVLILAALRTVTGQGDLGARGFFAALYALLVGISVLLGYGFWFDLTASTALARETYRTAMGDLLAPLTAFRQAYDGLARTAGELAEHSAARAEEERQTGGTCGGPPRRGPGPRKRLRERDAAALADIARHFKERAQAFGRLVEETRAAAGDGAGNHGAAVRAADTALDEAHALAADPHLEAVRETIRDRLAAAAGGFVDPESGERFACADPLLESRLKGLVAARLPALPAARAQLFEATHAASVQRGLQLLIGTAAFDRQRDTLPLAMGLAIDLLLLFLTLARRAGGDGPGPFAGLARRLDRSRLLPDGHAEAWLKVVRGEGGDGLAALLETWGLDDRGRPYLLAPLAGGGDGGAEARRLAAVLSALRLARRFCLLRPEQTPAWWRQPRADALARIERLQVYRLRTPLAAALILDEIRRALDQDTEAEAPVAAAQAAVVPLRRSPLRDDAFLDA